VKEPSPTPITAQALPEKSLQQKTLHGLGWSTFASLANSVMVLAYTAVITRLVAPEAFGVVTASGVILRFGGYFSDMGLGKALIQKAELTTSDIRAAFTGALALGLSFSALIFFLAPQLAPLVLADPMLVPILRLQSLSFIIGALNTVPTCLLKRQMNFAQIAKTDIIGFILAYGVVGISLAYLGYGIYGVAVAGMLSILASAVINYWLVRHTLRPIFEKEAFKPMLGYGSKVSFISFLEFLASNVDVLVIGRRLGAAMLGFYSRAQMLVQLPIYNLTQAMSKVLFPAMSSIQHDLPRLRRIYITSTVLLAAIIVPLGVGISVAAQEAIITVIGPKFAPAIPILAILAIMTPFRLLTYYSGIVCDSTGHLTVKIKTESVFLIINALAMWLVSKPYGVVGICYAFLISEILRFIVYLFILRRFLSFSFKDFLPGFVAVMAMAGFVGISIAGVRFVLAPWLLQYPLLALLAEALGGGIGLALGVLGPWSRVLRKEMYERFLAKSRFGNQKLVVLFVNL